MSLKSLRLSVPGFAIAACLFVAIGFAGFAKAHKAGAGDGQQPASTSSASGGVPTTNTGMSTRRSISSSEEIRALYFTGLMAGSEHGKQLATAWRASGGNAIVFDVKDSDGAVSFASRQPLAGTIHHPYIRDLGEWVGWLHTHGLYAIARQAVFKDERLAKLKPELAVRSRSHAGPWLENGKLAWLDPSLPEVQDYNISMALEVAASGVDEVQFDYIRFPAEGRQRDCLFHYQKVDPKADRADVISDYLYKAQKALKPTGVHLSIDVFGVMAWQRHEDLVHTGQDVTSLAYFCDVMCPMIYPSHFFNFDGVKDPGDAPEHFIRESLVRFHNDTRDSGVVIRPWLQAFAWRTHIYGPDYIRIQIQTARAQQAIGFMLWNAGNRYSVPEQAMPSMVAKPGVYFTGGFPYPIQQISSTLSTSAVANGR
jgi:hypothetical protein